MTCSQRKTTRVGLPVVSEVDLTTRDGVLSGCTVLEWVDAESLGERSTEGAIESSDGVEREDVFDPVAESNCPPVRRGCTSHLQLHGQNAFVGHTIPVEFTEDRVEWLDVNRS
jgi:hypothetical protein